MHSDVCGPISCASLGGSRYYVSFVDETSGFIRIVPIARKSQVADEFRRYVSWFERRAECTVKLLQSDNGGEYIALDKFLLEEGIEMRRSSPYSPMENGTAERANRTIVECARSMLSHASLPRRFWAEAVAHAADIRNRFFCPRREDMTSYEMLTSHKPRIDHLRVFGSLAWVHIPKEKRRKLDDKAEQGILIGCKDSSQYKVWMRSSQEAIWCRDIKIDEEVFPAREWFSEADDLIIGTETHDVSPSRAGNEVSPSATTGVNPPSQEEFPTVDNHPQGPTLPNLNEDSNIPILCDESEMLTYVPADTDDVENEDSQEENRTGPQSRYPRRDRTQTQFFAPGGAHTASSEAFLEPQTIQEALSMQDAVQWQDAIDSELSSLMAHETWELVHMPKDRRILPTRFVFQRKRNADGSFSRHKARLVVKGYLQGNVDFTFSPVVDFTTVRVALTLAVQKGLLVHQMDVKTAFLHGEIDQEVYISPPGGLPLCGQDEVLRLKKGLYGLKQAPRLCNEKWRAIM